MPVRSCSEAQPANSISFFVTSVGPGKGRNLINDSMDAPPAAIQLGTPLSDDYLAAMNVAGEYAYAGRDWVINRVLRIIGARDTLRVHNHHNFAWWEKHDGEKWLVVRKGATPAFPWQFGFVGGSMGDDAVIIRGKESPESRHALYSTVHGAGRVMGRMEAKGKWKGARCGRLKYFRSL
jgi:tRNA-splicing ligase RtcB (3'-phosphate/5'-hydroxy nucleic acid ligase)